MRMSILAVIVGLGSAGCGGQSEPVTRDSGHLRDLARMYAAYQDSRGKPPGSLGDLIDYQTKSGAPGLPAGVARMDVPWGAGLGRMYRGEDAAKTVFAHSSASGGVVPVLMADGTVTTIQEADLAGAKTVKPPKLR
jgi:hypothetical protein